MSTFDSIVLLSGGVESTILLKELNNKKKRVCGLIFDMGLPASTSQLHFAKKHIFSIGSYMEVVDLHGIVRMALGHFDPSIMIFDEGDVKCNDSYVPVLISNAIYYAQSANIKDVYVGLTKEQMRESSQEFFSNIGDIFGKYSVNLPVVSVHTPFADMTKADVVKLGQSLGVNAAESWSCFNGGVNHCGQCSSCKERKDAFSECGISDSTVYEK